MSKRETDTEELDRRHLPVGVVGKMTAFNFPYAVYGWGALPALATGNAVILKPHPAATLTSLAMVKVMSDVCKAEGLEGVISMISMASFEDTAKLWKDPRVDLWEVTGGEAMGQAFMRAVGPRWVALWLPRVCQATISSPFATSHLLSPPLTSSHLLLSSPAPLPPHSFRRTVLELGGNNAVIVDKDCNLPNVVESCLFGSTGTAGQRCTTTRSIFVRQKKRS